MILLMNRRGLASLGMLIADILAFLLAFSAAYRNDAPPFASLVIALVSAALVHILMTTDKKHIRGAKLLSYTQAREKARQILETRRRKGQDLKGFRAYGGIALPDDAPYENFLLLGRQGTGKSLQVFLLMYEAFVGKPKVKAILHDVKMELISFLRFIGVEEKRIKLIMPYDRRGYRWDIQRDSGNDDLAWDIARSFVPESESTKGGKFFIVGAQVLFYCCIRYLTYEGKKNPHFRWGLRDLFEALCSPQDMRAMFEKYPDELGMGIEYLEGENKDITRTMLEYVIPLRGIAALWEDRPPFSFTQWRDTDNGDIVILGFDDEFEEQCGILNATLFRRAMKAVLSHSGANRPDTWFFIDEFDSLNAIPGLANFLSKARSYRACVAIVLQAIEQITRKYDKEHKSIIPELCAHKILLQVTDESAEWASKQCGEEEIREERHNEDVSMRGMSKGKSETPTEKRLVLKSEISSMPIFAQDLRLHSWYVTAHLSNCPYYHEFEKEDIKHIWKDGGYKRDYDKVREANAFNLPAWTDDDRKRVGLPPRKTEPAKPDPSPQQQRGTGNDDDDRDEPLRWNPNLGL